MTNKSATYLKELHDQINQYFDLTEFRTLCFALNVDYDNLAGEEKQSRIRELLLSLGRREKEDGCLSALIKLLQQERPHVEWPPVPDDFQPPKLLDDGRSVTNQYDVDVRGNMIGTAVGDGASVTANAIVGGDIVQGDKVGGDKITIGDVSDGSAVASGAGANAIGPGGIQISGDVQNSIVNTGNIILGDIQKSLATYIKNKRDEWKKEETTAWHIRLSAQISPYSLKQEIEQKNVAVWTSTSNVEQAVAEFNGCCVVLGEPGSGKSTLLRKLAYEATLRYKDNSTEYLPVFLDLKQWPVKTEFEVYLIQHLDHETQYRKPVPYGEIVLFLDGLNEMAGDIEGKIKEINNFLKRLNFDPASKDGLRVIASCRNRSYTEKISLELPRIIINPLAEEQVRDYLRKREVGDLAPYLFGETDSDSKLATLVERPFFLDMLVGLYQGKAFDPDALIHLNRGLIIHRYVEYFWQRERNSQIRPYATYVPELEVIQQILEQLAFDMQAKNDGAAISAHTALQAFLKALGALSKLPRLKKLFNPEAKTQQEAEFLLRVSEAAAILKISSDGTIVEFQHDLLREYFAACYLHRRWQQNRATGRSNNKLYKYLGGTVLSHDEKYREQEPWDEVWFTFANLCEGIDLDAFIKEISDLEPFFAAEIASRANPSQACLQPLITTLIQYATAERKCGRFWNCQKAAVYALSNFTQVEAIINPLVHLLDKHDFYRVSRAVLWKIGQRIGITTLLQHIQDARLEGDDAIWGLYLHELSDDYHFKFEFFKFQWLFDEELYDQF